MNKENLEQGLTKLLKTFYTKKYERDFSDLTVVLDGKKHTAQVKPYSTMTKEDGKITMKDTGNVKPYDVDWLIFINTKSNKVLIFENKPIKNHNQYVFNESSLIHEIE